jgi:hypothetical protein
VGKGVLYAEVADIYNYLDMFRNGASLRQAGNSVQEIDASAFAKPNVPPVCLTGIRVMSSLCNSRYRPVYNRGCQWITALGGRPGRSPSLRAFGAGVASAP